LNNKKKVCFLNNVCPYVFEPRMFHKGAKTLTKNGYEVVIIVQHEKEEVIDGIRVIPLRRPKNRFERMTLSALKLLRLALREKAQVYHFHNPELIPIGLFLKFLGKKVIYDVHEAFSEKILSKPWINKRFRPIVSKAFSLFERTISRHFDYIIPADKIVAQNFKHHKNVCVIANYPILELLSSNLKAKNDESVRKDNKFILIYAGSITEDRGFFKMLNVMERMHDKNIELHLLGWFEDGIKDEKEKIQLIDNVKYLGFLSIEEVFSHLLTADIGLILFQPVPAYLYAGENTTKLFEYMVCKLPVLTSDFPNLKEIIESNKCGVCVDPTDTEKIIDSIEYLYKNPDIRKTMGENGKKTVIDKYNWEKDSEKLLAIYEKLCNRDK
jgi:glycosyltransferase involved in cell wall biosynthesis